MFAASSRGLQLSDAASQFRVVEAVAPAADRPRVAESARREPDVTPLQRASGAGECPRDWLGGIVALTSNHHLDRRNRPNADRPDRPARPDAPTPSQSPVDDATYDLLQALTSKLEAIEAYQMYAEDEEVRDLFERLGRDEVEHAEALLGALRERLNSR